MAAARRGMLYRHAVTCIAKSQPARRPAAPAAMDGPVGPGRRGPPDRAAGPLARASAAAAGADRRGAARGRLAQERMGRAARDPPGNRGQGSPAREPARGNDARSTPRSMRMRAAGASRWSAASAPLRTELGQLESRIAQAQPPMAGGTAPVRRPRAPGARRRGPRRSGPAPGFEALERSVYWWDRYVDSGQGRSRSRPRARSPGCSSARHSAWEAGARPRRAGDRTLAGARAARAPAGARPRPRRTCATRCRRARRALRAARQRKAGELSQVESLLGAQRERVARDPRERLLARAARAAAAGARHPRRRAAGAGADQGAVLLRARAARRAPAAGPDPAGCGRARDRRRDALRRLGGRRPRARRGAAGAVGLPAEQQPAGAQAHALAAERAPAVREPRLGTVRADADRAGARRGAAPASCCASQHDPFGEVGVLDLPRGAAMVAAAAQPRGRRASPRTSRCGSRDTGGSAACTPG